jgi:hypothetical protein
MPETQPPDNPAPAGLKCFFQRVYNRATTSVKSVLFALAVLLILVTSIVVFVFMGRSAEALGGHLIFQQRDFTTTPFSMMDAYDACVMESEARLGESLLRSHMLPLSTRYEALKDTYLVVINADVGNIEQWSEVMIYCNVNPAAEEISYYKEVYQDRPTLLSRSISVLTGLFD